MLLLKKKKIKSDWLDQSLKFLPWAGTVSVLLYQSRRNGFDVREWISTAASVTLRIGSVESLKNVVKERRPLSLKSNSFPSGHAASAFSAAEIIRSEGKDLPPPIRYGGYVLATAIGIQRVYSGKHWVRDVIAGAGIGIITTLVARKIFDQLITKSNSLNI